MSAVGASSVTSYGAPGTNPSTAYTWYPTAWIAAGGVEARSGTGGAIGCTPRVNGVLVRFHGSSSTQSVPSSGTTTAQTSGFVPESAELQASRVRRTSV